MGAIISVNFTNPQDRPIDITRLSSGRALRTGLIAPSVEDTSYELAPEHAAEPIKSMDDIDRICCFLKEKRRFRDYMMFVVGINFGLRVSDLLELRFSHLINDELVFRDRFAVFEKKTRNTRKSKKNRYISINDAVIEAVTVYLENTPDVKLSDYMFRSESNHGKDLNRPITRKSVNVILRGLAKDLGLGNKTSSHSLRKTFAYHQMVMSGNDSRKLLLLQRMFGHSSPNQTLDYIGITSEEIDKAYNELNLGSASNYLNVSLLSEVDDNVG